jgi:protein-disulfide isomerase
MMRSLLFAFGASVIVLITACSTSAQQARQPGPNDTVATVGGAAISLSQVDERALQQPAGAFGNARLGQALYLARRAALDDLIGNHLMDVEAKARGIDRPTLVEREIASAAPTPNDAEITAWYQANQGRVLGAPLEQVRAPIKALLIEERMDAARERFLGTLRAKTPVTITLEPPRLKVAAAGRPAKGPADAPVEVVEFSDFQCPFCQRANPTVQQVLSTYGDRIHFVYRHYPLPNHPDARPAAEAAACADEQGRFWPYHDRLFANPSKLSRTDLKQHAAELGLDAARFDACVDGHKSAEVVDADIKEANSTGMGGTPAFFINGRSLDGAQPFDAFKRIIDEELQLKKR